MAARILVPVDDSPEARRAVEQAAALAKQLQAAVTLMTVVVTPTLPLGLLDPAQVQLVTNHFRKNGERVLEDLRPVAEKAGAPVETRYAEGVPADEIVAEAGQGYAFIVMGHRGAGLAGKEQALLGSVSDRVLRQCPVPVLLVR